MDKVFISIFIMTLLKMLDKTHQNQVILRLLNISKKFVELEDLFKK